MFEQFFRGTVHTDLKMTKKRIVTKNSNINQFVFKPVSLSKCKRFRNTAMGGNFRQKPEATLKKPLQKETTIVTKKRIQSEIVFKFLHLCLNNIRATRPTHVCTSKNSLCFWSSHGRNIPSSPVGPSLTGALKALLISIRTRILQYKM